MLVNTTNFPPETFHLSNKLILCYRNLNDTYFPYMYNPENTKQLLMVVTFAIISSVAN